MKGRSIAALLALCALAAAPTAAAAASLPAAICTADAPWVKRETGALIQALPRLETAFRHLTQSLSALPQMDATPPARATLAPPRQAMARSYGELARLLPLRDAGPEAWPLKFLEEQLPAGLPLPQLTPPDRGEVLRAAFARALIAQEAAEQKGALVRFLARLDMTRALLAGPLSSLSDREALALLAGRGLAESYETGFREPARRLIDAGEEKLAFRLQQQVTTMCQEARP